MLNVTAVYKLVCSQFATLRVAVAGRTAFAADALDTIAIYNLFSTHVVCLHACFQQFFIFL